ncbi:MAG: TlpA family protein disulfide reductase [Chloroflexi bacterium]|nr:TlpA family protein disulfide reductase [Chloroflexota bacterium]MCL5273272.1 TlpA family protein disulfide reductase [Chloroflexota bacterium]
MSTDKRNGRLIVILAGAVVIAAFAGVFGVGMLLASQQGNRPKVGAAAPDFSMPLYANYRGGLSEAVRLSDLRGKVVVINFWASWCTECRKEAPGLEATYRRYKDRGVVLLGVDYLDTEPAALAYLREYETTYPVGADLQQGIARAYRITGVPETFVVDKTGKIRYVAIQRVSEAELGAAIEPLLAE